MTLCRIVAVALLMCTTITKGGSSATEASVVHLGIGAAVREHIGWIALVQSPECFLFCVAASLLQLCLGHVCRGTCSCL